MAVFVLLVVVIFLLVNYHNCDGNTDIIDIASGVISGGMIVLVIL